MSPPQALTFEQALAAAMQRRFGPAAQLRNLKRLSGGASQELWAFDVEGGGDTRPLILRRNPPGVPAREAAAGMATEARLLTLAADYGVPVPRVEHVFAPEEGCGTGFVMVRLEGETLGRKIVSSPLYAEARKTLAAACGEAFARIHGIDMARAEPLRRNTPTLALAGAEGAYRRLGTPRPVVEFALRWLHDHKPEETTPCVVHGELRNGNIIVGPEGLRAILDWEVVHIGEPAEDLGWICVNSWRFGEVDKPVGGFGTREQMFEAYERVSGRSVDPARVLWWEVLGTLRWGLTCAGMAEEFMNGDRSVERAAIGRRASETEIDLLALLLPRDAAVMETGHA